MVIRVRKGIARFLAILDSEGVAFFQIIVYAHLTVGGLYCLLVAGNAPETVRDALGSFFTMWLWLCVGATVCLAGKALALNKCRFWVKTGGLYLQFAGDAAAFGAFAGYVLSTLQETPWGKAVIAVWVFAALADCAFFLCWRDLRRIKQNEQLARQ